jgi:hypothetical protein
MGNGRIIIHSQDLILQRKKKLTSGQQQAGEEDIKIWQRYHQSINMDGMDGRDHQILSLH